MKINNKKGISLIVLVITIIVMIILAAAVIISMNNTGIIDKASHAVQLTDEKQVQDLASLLWAEAYLDEDRTDTIENVVKAGLAENKITDADWDINVSDTGVTISKKEILSVALITFTIDGTSYQAEEGMTWQEWVDSSYDNDEYWEGWSGRPMHKESSDVIWPIGSTSGAGYLLSDEIVANGTYELDAD